MRFTDERQVAAATERLWDALHDPLVLRHVIPGCEAMDRCGPGRYTARLAARVGPLSDTYRGRFGIEDLRPGSHLVVTVSGRGRLGSLHVDLDVRLDPLSPRLTVLRYDCIAQVRGLVAHAGETAMGLAGQHFTARFFERLGRAVPPGVPAGVGPARVPEQPRSRREGALAG